MKKASLKTSKSFGKSGFTAQSATDKLLTFIKSIAINGGVGFDDLNYFASLLVDHKGGGVKIEFKDLSKNQDQPMPVLHPAIYEYLDGESDRFGVKSFLTKNQLAMVEQNAQAWVYTPVHSSRYAANKIKIIITAPEVKVASWTGSITATTIEDLFNWIVAAMNGSAKSQRVVRPYFKVRHRITNKMHGMSALAEQLSSIVGTVGNSAKTVAQTLLTHLYESGISLFNAVTSLYNLNSPEEAILANAFC